MLARRCSLALLVTQKNTSIYRDTFADFTPDSIVLVGVFSTAEVLDLDEIPADERALQDAVQTLVSKAAKGEAARVTFCRDFLVP